MLLFVIRMLYIMVSAGAVLAWVFSTEAPATVAAHQGLAFAAILLIPLTFLLVDILIPRKRVEIMSAIYFGLLIGVLLAYLLNLGLSLELYQWEAEIWLWGRSLPVPVWKRWGRVVAAHIVLIVPETVVMLRNGALGFAEVAQLYLLGLSILIVLHLYLYKKAGLPENALQVILFGFVGLTLIILYKIPLLLLAACGMLFSLYAFPKWCKV